MLSLRRHNNENEQSMSAQVMTCLRKAQRHQNAVAVKHTSAFTTYQVFFEPVSVDSMSAFRNFVRLMV